MTLLVWMMIDYFTINRIEVFLKNWLIKERDIIFLFDSYLIKNGDKVTFPKHLKYFKKNIYEFRDLLVRNFIGNQIFIKTEDLEHTMDLMSH